MSTLVLENVAWETYQRLLFEVGEQARLTYDRGCLEIEMSPLLKHEAPKRLLESLVEFFCEEHELAFLPLGSTTFSLETNRQGAEPDSGFILGERAEISGDYTESDPTTIASITRWEFVKSGAGVVASCEFCTALRRILSQ
jgi:Uma2 family endonuclease